MNEPKPTEPTESAVRSSDLLERRGYDRLWLWFGIGRSAWITLPRVLAHEMPDDWQDKMAALLEEYERTYTNWPDGIGTRVQITDSGHLTSCYNWLNNYRYPAKGKIETLRSNEKAEARRPGQPKP